MQIAKGQKSFKRAFLPFFISFLTMKKRNRERALTLLIYWRRREGAGSCACPFAIGEEKWGRRLDDGKRWQWWVVTMAGTPPLSLSVKPTLSVLSLYFFLIIKNWFCKPTVAFVSGISIEINHFQLKLWIFEMKSYRLCCVSGSLFGCFGRNKTELITMILMDDYKAAISVLA